MNAHPMANFVQPTVKTLAPVLPKALDTRAELAKLAIKVVLSQVVLTALEALRCIVHISLRLRWLCLTHATSGTA